MPIKRCPLVSPECALFIVAQLLPRSLGGKSSVATKTHSEEQKSNSKGQQALVFTYHFDGTGYFTCINITNCVCIARNKIDYRLIAI
ncbi:hypothetical protein L1D59_10005 [Pseudoalteromonas piscicida]|uniref:hypothetical protein n=1 Tax=Pseudoalteromonas piscicida TaxID=43662 RepID=UPI001EFE2841|nr:hypothetical protein [Pseudoalteromonas piscicida]